jgi:hypothetical protein
MGFQSYEGLDIWIKHMISSSNSIIVPLSADDITTANVQDNQVYNALTSSLPSTTVKKTHYMIADPGYDDQNLYDLSTGLNFQLVCPVHRYKNTTHKKDFNWLISINLH